MRPSCVTKWHSSGSSVYCSRGGPCEVPLGELLLRVWGLTAVFLPWRRCSLDPLWCQRILQLRGSHVGVIVDERMPMSQLTSWLCSGQHTRSSGGSRTGQRSRRPWQRWLFGGPCEARRVSFASLARRRLRDMRPLFSVGFTENGREPPVSCKLHRLARSVCGKAALACAQPGAWEECLAAAC